MCELIPVLILPIVGVVWCVLCILFALIPFLLMKKIRKEYDDDEFYKLFPNSHNCFPNDTPMMNIDTNLRFHKMIFTNKNNIDKVVGSLRKQYKYVLIGLLLCLLAMASTMTYFVSYCGTN